MSVYSALVSALETHPQYLNYATLGLMVLPFVPFCRLAALIAVCFLVSFASPETKTAALLLCPVLAFLLARHTPHIFVVAFCLSLAAVAGFEALGLMHPYEAYWLDYKLSIVRNCIIPFCADWPRLRATLRHGLSGYKHVRTRYDRDLLTVLWGRLRPLRGGLSADAASRTMAP